MRKQFEAAVRQPTTIDAEHHLVAELRQAMAAKDIATMGQMLELLGTIQAELKIGQSVFDNLVAGPTDPNAGSPQTIGRAAGKAPSSSGGAAIRTIRQ